jgi:hypothetical protein
LCDRYSPIEKQKEEEEKKKKNKKKTNAGRIAESFYYEIDAFDYYMQK